MLKKGLYDKSTGIQVSEHKASTWYSWSRS